MSDTPKSKPKKNKWSPTAVDEKFVPRRSSRTLGISLVQWSISDDHDNVDVHNENYIDDDDEEGDDEVCISHLHLS